MSDKKTKEEMIDETLEEAKKDILRLDFGRVIIYVQKGYPFRKEVVDSKKIERGLDKSS